MKTVYFSFGFCCYIRFFIKFQLGIILFEYFKLEGIIAFSGKLSRI